MTNYYELLSVESSAPPEEIRRAFRQEIARYHPDKVHHLGKEFQEMAATRAAQLTEAYRTLMNAELRAEYDRMLDTIQTPPGRAASLGPEAPTQAASTPVAPPPSAGHAEPTGSPSTQFSEERSSKDEFVRKATLGRLRKILTAEFGTFSEVPVRGFDLVCATAKTRLFGKSRPVPNLFVRLVREVNSAAIQETWTMALKVLGAPAGDVCVLLLGTVGSHREANAAVAALKGQPGRAAKAPMLIPVDIRDWSAQLHQDMPRSCRSILEMLKKAT